MPALKAYDVQIDAEPGDPARRVPQKSGNKYREGLGQSPARQRRGYDRGPDGGSDISLALLLLLLLMMMLLRLLLLLLLLLCYFPRLMTVRHRVAVFAKSRAQARPESGLWPPRQTCTRNK